jgi:hypothetical protein
MLAMGRWVVGVIACGWVGGVGCAVDATDELAAGGSEAEVADQDPGPDDVEIDEEGKKKLKPLKYRYAYYRPWANHMVPCPDADLLRTYVRSNQGDKANGMKCGASGLEAQAQCGVVAKAAPLDGNKRFCVADEGLVQTVNRPSQKTYVYMAYLYEVYR